MQAFQQTLDQGGRSYSIMDLYLQLLPNHTAWVRHANLPVHQVGPWNLIDDFIASVQGQIVPCSGDSSGDILLRDLALCRNDRAPPAGIHTVDLWTADIDANA